MRLTKKQVIIVVSGLVLAGALVGAGLWWHGSHKPRQLSNVGGTTGNPNISLDQSGQNNDSGGLSVSGQASDLGQLGGNDGQSGSGGGQSGSSGSSGGVDPSTFSRFNKYKNNKSALYSDVAKGTGAALTGGKQANVYYKAWLSNGALVDQSPVSASGKPQSFNFTMGAHQVIPGLEQGVYGMKAGGTRLVIIPPAVGYGSQTHGSVPAESLLVFEVQLVSVK